MPQYVPEYPPHKLNSAALFILSHHPGNLPSSTRDENRQISQVAARLGISALPRIMSALPPKADIRRRDKHVRFGAMNGHSPHQLITSSGRIIERCFKARNRLNSYGRTATYA
jgi:hypothetical protein